MSGKAYGAIAGLYELLMEVDYDGWADYVISKINKYAPGKKGADIGCGSGAFTRRFKRAGFDVSGFDLSEEMLAEAVRLTKQEGLNITYVKQDIRSLRLNGRVDFITALTDCFNYLPPKDVPRALKKIHAALSKGGVLVFDVSTEYKINRVIADNMFGEDGEDFSYLWFNRPFEGGVEMDISVFTKNINGSYDKKEEHHVQYAHSSEFLISALEQCGFAVAEVEGHLGEEITPAAQRVNFVAIRQ